MCQLWKGCLLRFITLPTCPTCCVVLHYSKNCGCWICDGGISLQNTQYVSVCLAWLLRFCVSVLSSLPLSAWTLITLTSLTCVQLSSPCVFKAAAAPPLPSGSRLFSLALTSCLLCGKVDWAIWSDPCLGLFINSTEISINYTILHIAPTDWLLCTFCRLLWVLYCQFLTR